MSEAADELERMAEEFERGAVEMKETAGTLESLSSRLLTRGEAVGFEASAKRLRDRAAEIRGAVDAAPKATSKPRFMARSQWWRCRYASPGRVVDLIIDDDGEACAIFEGIDGDRWAKETRIVTSSPHWIYLGDGPEPAQNA